MNLRYLYFFILRGLDGSARKGCVLVGSARNEREADVLAAEQLRNAGLLRRGDEVFLRCLSRA